MKNKFQKGKMRIILIGFMFMFLIWGISFCQNSQNQGQKPQQKPQSLSQEQVTTIKNILSKYNSSTFTATDARAIHMKFREAGIHAGPETRDVIIAAGFDPEKLRTLDPPPDENNPDRQKPPSAEERLAKVQTTIIKPLSLNASQSETVLTAYKGFFSEMDNLRKMQENSQVPIDKLKMESLEKKRDNNIKQVLTEAQFKKYQELEKASRPPRPDEPGRK
jgi:hypothetical protein